VVEKARRLRAKVRRLERQNAATPQQTAAAPVQATVPRTPSRLARRVVTPCPACGACPTCGRTPPLASSCQWELN